MDRSINEHTKTFPETKLLVTDTDSFCYEITSEKDIYDIIKGNDWFDFSNYDKDHPLFDASKKLKPEYFKDEFGGKIPLEVIGLRPKMYSILLLIGLIKSAAKGVNKTVKDGVITHQDFKDTLFHCCFPYVRNQRNLLNANFAKDHEGIQAVHHKQYCLNLQF